MKRAILTLFSVILLTAAVQAETYEIDPAHSSVAFRVKHMIGKVSGHFDKFSGKVDYDAAKPQAWKTQAAIEANSINTGIEKRDNHLRSPDFFDVQKFPTLSFKSTGITDMQGNKAKLHGDLTMHGVTKPVVLDLEIAGVVADAMGKGNRLGATAHGHLSRNDYGVGPNSGPMSGMVGDDIEILIDVEGVSKK